MMTERSESNPGDIEQIRDDIDRIDADILKLLAERKAHSLRIAKEKGIHDRPSRDQAREEGLISDRIAAGMEACVAWRRPCRYPYSLVLAGDVLFAGGAGEVAAMAADDGRRLWSGNVTGRALDLALPYRPKVDFLLTRAVPAAAVGVLLRLASPRLGRLRPISSPTGSATASQRLSSCRCQCCCEV